MAVDQTLMTEDETGRLAAVRRYDVLDTPPDGAFDRVTSLAAKHFQVPIAIVSIVDSDRIWFKSHHGLDVPEVGRDPGLCASAILDDKPWVVEDAATDPRTIANPLVAGALGLRFYAGAPLTTRDGYNLGTLCVIDHQPRDFSADQADTLADMAALVVDELELRLATRRAVDHELELRRQAELMARELQASLLPPELRSFSGAELAALYLPARAGLVGGDFYDVFGSGDLCTLVVGDVSGKGAGAAAVTALARHAIRTASLSAPSPAAVLETLNRAMLIDRLDSQVDYFCTALIVAVRRRAGGLDLTVAAAGHPPGLILRADGATAELGADGPPVGWYADPVFTLATGRLELGDTLLIFTDGVTEARTPTGLLGVDAVARRLAAPVTAGPAQAIQSLVDLLTAPDVDVRDDAAAVALRAV